MSKRNDDKSTDLLLTKSRNVLGNLSKEEQISKKSDLLTNSSESNKSRSNELLNSCLRKCPSVQCNDELYTFQDRILHHKCAVVKLVRNQMSEFSNILDDETDLLNKQTTLIGKLKQWKYKLLALLFTLFLLWLAFLYGTVLGAYICSGKSMKLCKICTIIIHIMPGLQYTQNTRNVF